MRPFLCAAVALAVLAAATHAADEAKKKKKKNAAGLSGEIVKIDGAAGTVTVKVQVTKSSEEKDYKVTSKTTVTEVKGNEKTELKADKVEELFKKEQFKPGATVSFEAEEDGKTLKSLTFGPLTPKKKKKNK